MNKRIYITVGITFTCACIILFHVFYVEARQTAIKNLNEIQRVYARQAAVGIESFFTNRTNSLKALSNMEDIVNNNAEGQKDLKLFYEAHREQITAITRMDEKGIVIYNFPDGKNIIGNDISTQKHVKQLLKDHKPVISDVFQSVEGISSVAIHVPVFKGSDFKGSVGVLIDFKSLAKHYFESIKIGQTGNAWVISRDGTVLYSPIPGFTGKSEYANIVGFPSLLPIVNDMIKGHAGTAEFMFNKIGDKTVPDIKKYSIYMPIQLGNTFWSINVSTTEDDILADLNSFRNKLIILIISLYIFGAMFFNYGVKALLIIKEEEKRKAAEDELRKSETRFHNIFNNLQDAYFEADKKGKLTFVSPSALKMYGYNSAEELLGINAVNLYADPIKRGKLLKQLKESGKIIDYDCLANRKDNTTFWVSMNIQFMYDSNEQICGTVGVVRDITERKNHEIEMEKKITELKWYYDISMQRELKMADLKKEINELLIKSGKEKRYL